MHFVISSQHARVLLISTHVPVAAVSLFPGHVTWMMTVVTARMNQHLVVFTYVALPFSVL